MEKKFTQGEYQVTDTCVFVLEHTGQYYKGQPKQRNRVYALVQGHPDMPHDEKVATAQLFAAAPALLEALERAVEEAIFPSKALSDVYEKAKAAINKACGKE